ncbi:AAA family ATPase [Pantoea sp. ACRSH]|uniref:DnaB-like helicase C-terminal domain-containing protein n=1 Tax=unclassified Pantoea TaxID=2630326 RepID=UPI001EF61B82|nr:MULTISPECIES: DnaB-like helicase C-terminal domain-containing protein [unclassified Pantoea]MCG7368031.1 AAA family ATPase [Pantoea sp. ACRSH]MCG7398390.1 AAA family ATPase [Pantoea sp. ACRSC]
MTDNILMPPHSLDAEQAVLGGLMLDGGDERTLKVMAMLKPESFFSGPHANIFTAIKDLLARNQPIDPLTLSDVLEASDKQYGGFSYLAELTKNTPSVANLVHYAAVVRDKAMERYAICKLNEATEMLYSRNSMTAVEKLESISALTTQISDYAKTGNRRGLRSFGDVMDSWVADLEKRFDPNGEQRGMSTGIPSLDRMLAPKGLVKGSLFVIGARPKMGKTTLYGQMAINCAIRENKPALMFSLEMPADQILEKLVGQKSGVNPSIFYMPATDDADDTYQGDYDGDFDKAIKTANRLRESDLLYIDDTPGLSLAHIVAECRKVKRQKGEVGMVLVDYLTLMTAEKADRNDLAYGLITKGLKNLAKELGCVVVLLTQLNRELEKRVNKRPLPSDSRDTGQIEQDCDYWVGIHREGAYDESVPAGETELILRLNRHGETGTVFCLQKNGAIYDMDQQSARAERDSRQAPAKSKGGF